MRPTQNQEKVSGFSDQPPCRPFKSLNPDCSLNSYQLLELFTNFPWNLVVSLDLGIGKADTVAISLNKAVILRSLNQEVAIYCTAHEGWYRLLRSQNTDWPLKTRSLNTDNAVLHFTILARTFLQLIRPAFTPFTLLYLKQIARQFNLFTN